VVPIIHQARYLTRTAQQNVPTSHACLQYAMWALATCSSTQFQELRSKLHAQARVMLEGLHSSSSIEQAQAWLLIAHYEFCYMDFQRAWITMGRAIRVIQSMKLYEMDQQTIASSGVTWGTILFCSTTPA
jgi:hypothetical protein